MSWTPDHMKDQKIETPTSTKNPFKWGLLGVGCLVAIAHIGALGHMMKMT